MSHSRVSAAMLCLLLVAGVAMAQTTGTIRGVVTDQTGSVLPGATVTISSEALLGGSRTTVSSEDGVFRFPALSVGIYSVEISMDGFETVRVETVDVRLNATANVPVGLQLGGVTEDITVVGEAPVVDVAASNVSTSFKNEMLEELPTRRSMADLMQVSPGMTADVEDGGDTRVVAFGSNRQSNSWNIDGADVSGPETGSAWWDVNVDNIEEIQVMGVGAPAEFGNHTGAVLNVVTKKGGNAFHGGASYFWQHDKATGVNVELDDSDYTFHRERYYNAAAQLGGPIKKDRAWFYTSFQSTRDASTEPGVDPSFTPEAYADQYDLKLTTRLGDRHEASVLGHYESWGYPNAANPYTAPSALSGEWGHDYAWGASLTSTLSDKLVLELRYRGFWSDDWQDSQTGSFEEPFIDYSPPGGGPTTYSGGVWYPWDYVTWRQQLNVKATYFAEDFLNSEHEFKFGVQYSRGSAKTNVGIGPDGTYAYHYTYNYYGTDYDYFYRVYQDPYQYGGVSTDMGFFLDDSIKVNDRLTLNLGVRFDRNTGSIPDYQRLTIGQPSISRSGNFAESAETLPGVHNLIDWKLISPRIGFAYQPTGNSRSVIRGSFGVYYDQNVIGNWDAPPPGYPTQTAYLLDPVTMQRDSFAWDWTQAEVGFDPDLKAPRALQYAIGFEQQLADDISLGAQYVYKTTKDLVGWEILGGVYEPFLFTDPFTGNQYTLLNAVEPYTFRKGNDPGDFPGSEGMDYFQKYNGVILTFDKRFADRWGLSASYTWSRSEGRLPRMFTQTQFNPFYGNTAGRDPNQWFNTDSRLQGDRPHMFRLQSVLRLPYDIQLSTSMEFASGRPYSRQIRVFGLEQGSQDVIMDPIGTYRYGSIKNVDVLLGKRFYVGKEAYFRLEGWVFNLLNSDQVLFMSSLRLQDPDEDDFVPDTWTRPRRLQLRLGFYF